MIKIADAGNVMNPALLVLTDWGYKVWIENDDETAETIWWAERPNEQYCGCDPLALLGVVTIGRERGANWKTAKDEPNTYRLLLKS